MPILFKQSPSGGRIGGHPSTNRLPSTPSGTHLTASGSVSHHLHPRPSASRAAHSLTSLGTSIARRASRGKIRSRSSIGALKSRWAKFLRYLKDPRLLVPLIKRAYRRWHLKHLIPLLFVALYMLIGATIFYWLESGEEVARLAIRTEEYRKESYLLVKRIEEIIEDQAAASSASARRRFVEEAITHFHSQLQIQPVQWPQWSSYWTAMYFAGTIFTTIGYGDVYCETAWGRIVTVLYAIFGVPLMLITLNELGKFLYKTINEWVARVNKLIERSRNKLRPKRSTPTIVDVEKGEGGITLPIEDHVNMDSANETRRVSFKLNPEDDLTLKLDVSEEPDAKRGSISSGEERIILPSSAVLKLTTTPAGEDSALLFHGDGESDALGGGDSSTSDEKGYNYDEEAEFLEKEPTPRMHVLVALSCTVGWIFVCAALFKTWETEWSYAESCYFIFISLSTIGLGDVQVQRKDYVVLCFLFVIIGLSLVSMCINVIQSALEDLYRTLLMKILMDYQAKLASGGDHKGASVGMMQAWGNSKTAKYLMPMLSAETRLSVMHKIQGEAKEAGMEIPPIFEDIDDKTGMPKILAMSNEISDLDSVPSAMLEEIMQKSDPARVTEAITASRSLLPTAACYESCVQTDQVLCDDKNDQTIRVDFDELAIQTELQTEERNKNPVGLSEEIQTDSESSTPTKDEEVQTMEKDLRDVETLTFSPSFSVRLIWWQGKIRPRSKAMVAIQSLEVQTDKVLTVEEALQTYIIDLLPNETQTDEIETRNERIQTPYPEFEEVETQTDDIEFEELKGPSKISQATSRIRRAFQSRSKDANRVSQGPSMSQWKEHPLEEVDLPVEVSSSYESLNWDPIDGLHAEKQRPVKDLKKLFDQSKASVYQHRRSLGSQRRKSAVLVRKSTIDSAGGMES